MRRMGIVVLLSLFLLASGCLLTPPDKGDNGNGDNGVFPDPPPMLVENKVRNSSFEEESTRDDEEGRPAFWAWTAGVDGFTWTDSVAYEGEWSVCMTAAGEKMEMQTQYYTMSVTAGTTYQLFMHVKAEDVTSAEERMRLYVRWRDNQGAFADSGQWFNLIDLEPGWNLISTQVVAPEGDRSATSAQLFIRREPGDEGTVWVDLIGFGELEE